MVISSTEAAEALRDIARTDRRTRVSGAYHVASPHLILWGLIWAAGYTGCGLTPAEQMGPGVAAADRDRYRRRGRPRHAGRRRKQGRSSAAGRASQSASRSILALAIGLFIGSVYFVFQPVSPLPYLVFPALITALGLRAARRPGGAAALRRDRRDHVPRHHGRASSSPSRSCPSGSRSRAAAGWCSAGSGCGGSEHGPARRDHPPVAAPPDHGGAPRGRQRAARIQPAEGPGRRHRRQSRQPSLDARRRGLCRGSRRISSASVRAPAPASPPPAAAPSAPIATICARYWRAEAHSGAFAADPPTAQIPRLPTARAQEKKRAGLAQIRGRQGCRNFLGVT